jgi:WD40 repeat protein
MDALQLFLSYNSADRDVITQIQQLLRARGITTFLDRDNLVAGLSWPDALEQGLRDVRAVAVFIGRQLGGWQKKEMGFALDRQVREEKQGRAFPVIPVLLPGADLTPGFLFLNTWIDLRNVLRGGLNGAGTAEALDAFERAIRTTAPAQPAERAEAICPYRGLQAFREEDAALFTGREAFSRRLLEFTLGNELVTVVGPSGSGKSSVVQAGLVPLLRRERPPARTWDAVSFTPGSDPFHRLASSLIPLLEPELTETERLTEAQKLGDRLTSGEARLESVIDRVIEKSNGTGRLLVVADQFEELFTIAPEPDRRPFAQVLLRAVGSARFTLLLILRADFYRKIIDLDRELSDRIPSAQVNVGALTPDELRESIAGPARLVGLDFEPGLADRILGDAGGEPGSLPLVEFALTELWSRRHDRTLTNAAYNEMGGVTGALEKRAETEFARFTREEQAAARRLFSRLVRVARPEEGAEDIRQRLELNAADATTGKVVQALVQPEVRLLVTGRDDQSGSQTVEVAHEALIRNWERLRGWLNEDREFLLWRQRLQLALEGYGRSPGDAGSLLRGAPLAEAEHWLTTRPQDLTDAEQRFVGESIALRERETEESEQRRRDEIAKAQQLKELAEARAEIEQHRAAEQEKHAAERARQVKQLRRFSLGLAVLLLLAVAAVAFAFWQQALARARQLVATSILAESDPELSVLIAAQSVSATWPWGHTVVPEAANRLHGAIVTSHIRLTLRGHRDSVLSVAWSPEGKRLATASADKTAKVWDAETGKVLLTLTGHDDEVYSVAWSPDGKRLATASADKTAKVWDAQSGKGLLTLSGHTGPISSVAWSPPQTAEDDSSSNAEAGERLATGSYDKTAKVWDAQTGRLLRTLLGHTHPLTSVAWSVEDALATGAKDDTGRLWNPETGKTAGTLVSREPVTSVAWSPQGERLAMSSYDQTVQVWDASLVRSNFYLVLTLRGREGFLSVSWSPDGKQLGTGNDDNTAKIWDVQTDSEMSTTDIRQLMAVARRRVTALPPSEDDCKKYLHVDKCPPFPKLP